MLNTPFAFMAPKAEAGFDPTLGGAISPYFWYDFTDTGSMAFSASKVIEIDSKGSNTGSLARGTGTKYTTNWIGPEFDGTNLYTVFSGSSTTNSSLARRYGSGDQAADGGGAAGDDSTAIVFFQPDWDLASSDFYRLVNWKGYNTTVNQPEEWSIAAMTNGTTYPGTTYYASTSPSSVITALVSQKYFPNVSIYYSYSGSANVDANGIGPWNSWFAKRSGGGTSYNAGRTTTEDYSYTGAVSAGSNSAHEGLVIGSRSRTDQYAGPQFKIRHYLFYDSALTDVQIEALIQEYKDNYPSDNLNP